MGSLSSDLRQLLPHTHIEVVCQRTIIFKRTFPMRCTGGPSDSELLLPASVDSRSDSMAMSSGSTPRGTSRPSAASFAITDCRYSFSSSQRMCSTCDRRGGGGGGRERGRRGRRGREEGRWHSQMAQDGGLHVNCTNDLALVWVTVVEEGITEVVAHDFQVMCGELQSLLSPQQRPTERGLHCVAVAYPHLPPHHHPPCTLLRRGSESMNKHVPFLLVPILFTATNSS